MAIRNIKTVFVKMRPTFEFKVENLNNKRELRNMG